MNHVTRVLGTASADDTVSKKSIIYYSQLENSTDAAAGNGLGRQYCPGTVFSDVYKEKKKQQLDAQGDVQ